MKKLYILALILCFSFTAVAGTIQFKRSTNTASPTLKDCEVAVRTGMKQRVFLGNTTAHNNSEFAMRDATYSNMSTGASKGLSALQVIGTTTNDTALSGQIGEYILSLVSAGSAVSLSSNTAANITSISLTPGDWDVEANINYSLIGATITQAKGGISTTSITLPIDGSEVYSSITGTTITGYNTITPSKKRISLSSITTIYLVGSSTFSAGTVSAFGSLNARRVR